MPCITPVTVSKPNKTAVQHTSKHSHLLQDSLSTLSLSSSVIDDILGAVLLDPPARGLRSCVLQITVSHPIRYVVHLELVDLLLTFPRNTGSRSTEGPASLAGGVARSIGGGVSKSSTSIYVVRNRACTDQSCSSAQPIVNYYAPRPPQPCSAHFGRQPSPSNHSTLPRTRCPTLRDSRCASLPSSPRSRHPPSEPIPRTIVDKQ